MIQSQLITSVNEWERRLEFEEERRKNHRFEPFVNYLAPLQRARKEKQARKDSRAPTDFLNTLSANL